MFRWGVAVLFSASLFWNDGPTFGLVATAEASPIPLRERASFYHTADEIHSRLQKLAGSCPNADMELSQQGSLDVVKIRGKDDASGSKKRAMLIFGEHARELITSESALHLVESLCSGDSAGQEALKGGVEFTIMPSVNPLARKLVEDDGYYCKRTNEHGVDLNRNYGDQHRDTKTYEEDRGVSPDADDQGGHGSLQRNPGPQGFSEPETQAVRQVAEETKPDLFVSVHSGAYTLSMPWGFSKDATPPPQADRMEAILKGISEKFCGGSCPYGPLASDIGYDSLGCSMDYAAEELQVPLAFTWEIYTDQKHKGTFTEHAADDADERQEGFWKALSRRERRIKKAEDGASFLGVRRKGLDDDAGTATTATAADGETVVRDKNSDSVDDDCFNQFNPGDEGTFREVLENWTGAYLTVAKDLLEPAASAGATTGEQHGLTSDEAAYLADKW